MGDTEWLKGSTVAKDLSWPKIAHRFETQVVTPSQPAPTVEAAAAPVEEPADQYARAPAPLRQMLREQQQQRQLVPSAKPDTKTQTTTKSWDVDLAEVDRATRDLGALSRAMTLLGAAALKISLSFLNQIIGWIKRLLEKLFGIGVRETQLDSGPQTVAYEPYTLEGETREVPNADAAVQLVNQVTAALEAKDAALLPDVEGRDQIAAAMLTDPGRQPEQNVLDDIFANDSADAAAPAPEAPAPAPAAPVKSAWVAFSEAAKAYSAAAAAVQQAQLKPIMYIDGRPLAQERHDAATAECRELEKAHVGWKTENRLKSALGADPLNLKARAEAAQARAAQTKTALLKAEKEHAEFEILFEKTPTPAVPFALLDKHAAAAEALNKAQQLLISKARLNLNILDGNPNPMARQKREAFGAQLRRSETRMAAFLMDPRTQPKVVADLEETLRSLAAEVNVERARLAPRPADEDGQPGDATGQHGQAVPGQR